MKYARSTIFLFFLLFTTNILISQNQIQEKKYYENGNIKEILINNDSIKTKIWFNEDGIIKQIESSKHQHSHGKFIQFYNNSQIFVEGQYINDTPTGFWCEFYNTGDTLCKYSFTNGEILYNKEILNPIIEFENSIDSIYSDIENKFRVIFPDAPNYFINVSIDPAGSIRKYGGTEYSFKTKLHGEIIIKFIYENRCIYTLKLNVK